MRKNGSAVGTHAVALENMKRNAKRFRYPETGFDSPIEHSLLYAMLREPKIYPPSALQEQIKQEDYDMYITIKDKEDRVSYAQLSAVVVMATENFPPQNGIPTDVGQCLCKRILNCIVQYAEAHGLNRESEIQDLLDPVTRYFEQSGDKLLIPLYAGLLGTMVTGNPIPYLVGFAAVAKGAEQNAERLNAIAGEAMRKSDAEKTSLLDETDDF
jgi:hypothetical protein